MIASMFNLDQRIAELQPSRDEVRAAALGRTLAQHGSSPRPAATPARHHPGRTALATFIRPAAG